MTACPAHLFDGPLACTLHAGHAFGHRYESTSATDDRHGEGGHG